MKSKNMIYQKNQIEKGLKEEKKFAVVAENGIFVSCGVCGSLSFVLGAICKRAVS